MNSRRTVLTPFRARIVYFLRGLERARFGKNARGLERARFGMNPRGLRHEPAPPA